MAITDTPRFGLPQWGAGSDSVNHEQFNAAFAALESLGAVCVQGVLSARPAAGAGLRFYYATDTGVLYFDTGSAWVIPFPPIVVTLSPTWALSGQFDATSGSDSFMPPLFVASPAGQTVKLINVRAVLRSGSATVSMGAAGTPIPGLTAMAVTTTPATFTPTSAPTLSDGELLGPTISAITGTPDGLTVTATLAYTPSI